MTLLNEIEEINVNDKLNYVHLISGGLDSTYSLMKLAKSIIKGTKERFAINPVFFDYGQCAAETEFKCALSVVDKIISEFDASSILQKPINISLSSDLFKWCKNVAFTGKEIGDETCEIQNRNMVLISILASFLFACADNQKIESTVFEIHSGFKDSEMDDCSASFFQKLSDLLLAYKPCYKIKLEPLPRRNRQQVINKMKELLRGDESKLKEFKGLTISCYSPQNGKPCGVCWKCKSLIEDKDCDHRSEGF